MAVIDDVAASNQTESFVDFRIVEKAYLVSPDTCTVDHIFGLYFVPFTCQGVFKDSSFDFAILTFDEVNELSSIDCVSWHKRVGHLLSVAQSSCQDSSQQHPTVIEGPVFVHHSHRVLRVDVLKGRDEFFSVCLLYTSPSPRDLSTSRMPSSA